MNSNGNAADFNTPVPRFAGPLDTHTAFNIKACAPKPSLTSSLPTIAFQTTIGDPAPVPVTVAIGSTGSALDFTVSSDQAWLLPSSSAGNTGGSNLISVSVNPSALAAGTYTGNILINSSGATAPLKIGVTLKLLPAPIAVTVTTNPPNLQLYIKSPKGGPFQMNSPQVYLLQPGDTLDLTPISPQRLYSSATTQYIFQNWSDGSFGNHTFTLTGTTPVTLTANFKTQYYLSLATAGIGKGTVQPANGYFDANAAVLLTATADACSAFAGWNPTITNGSITMDATKTVTATFNDDTASVAGSLAADGKTEQGQLHFVVTGNRRVTGTNRWRRTYNVTNNGAALSRIRVALDGPLSNASALFNAEGTTSCAKPAGSGFIALPNLATGATAGIMLEVTTIDPTQPWSGALRVLASGKP